MTLFRSLARARGPGLLCLWWLLAGTVGSAQGLEASGASDAVAGRVVSATGGRPPAHALVTLTDNVSNRTVSSVRAGDDGAFRFGPVPTGRYRLEGQAAGFLRGAYRQHGQFSTAIVTGAGLPVNDLVLSLMPQASITGRLVDEAGDAIPHATLTLFRQEPGGGTPAVHIVSTTAAEDDGSFEFGPLQPGRFYLAANATPWYAVHPPPPPEVDGNRVLLDGIVVTRRLREPDVTAAASRVSVHPRVRRWMVEQQRALGAGGGVVMEGRDIGTVVFPDAEVKIFLDAAPEVRGTRRYRQTGPAATPETEAAVIQELKDRDARDRNRAESPLRPAADATVLDTTRMTLDEVLHTVDDLVCRATGTSVPPRP